MNDLDKRVSPGGDGRGVADAGMEGTMASGLEIEPEGDDFAHFAGAARTFGRSSCCISSLLRAVGESLSSECFLGLSASCLFVEFLELVRDLIVFEDPSWSSAFANCFVRPAD